MKAIIAACLIAAGTLAVSAPASAAVSVHIGNGGISFRDHHYYRGHGYYYHNNWYQHRSRWHGSWRYR
jgi:hypothetical protein